MARAKRQYHDHEVMAMARHLCRRAVETEIKRKGEKLRDYSFKQIVQLGDEYLREHTAEVMREVHTWQLEREVVQILKLVHRRRKTEIKGNLCASVMLKMERGNDRLGYARVSSDG